MTRRGWLAAAAGSTLLAACGNRQARRRFRIVNRFPHDPLAYTQGLLFRDGFLYESTGLRGQSSVRKVELETGRVLQRVELPAQLFGEGLVWVAGTLIQLTWQAGTALVYNSATFQPLRTFRYTGEGWGLAYDGESLVMSDGSDRLTFRDPVTFKVRRSVSVKDGSTPVRSLNELELIDGEIWANVYRSDDIVRIAPANGAVTERLNLAGLVASSERNGREDVLNGIAYDNDRRRLFLTGKRYSYIYEVEI